MKKPSINIHTLKKENVFQIPFQYFEQLPAEIQQKLAAMNGYEIAQLSKENVFNVPFAYFKTLPLEIQQKLNREEVFARNPKQSPFEVPANFFEGLTEKINEKIAYKTIENTEKANVFQTPAQYFEWLPAKIQARVRASEQTTKQSHSILKKWYQPAGYLALGVLSIWIFLGIFNQKNTEQVPDEQTQIVQQDTQTKIEKDVVIDTLSNTQAVAQNEAIQRNIEIDQRKISANISQQRATQLESNTQKNTQLRLIDFEIEQLEPQDILNYLAYTATSDNLLLDLMLEQEEESMTEETLLALNEVLEEDIYEEINHKEFEELNQLLKETK